MARYRQFLCAFWDDPDVEQMNPNEKLVFAYLFTNKLASESGIYPISVKKISFATGLKQNMTEKLLRNLNNVMYDFENQVVFVINMLKHNKRGNPELIAKSIIKDIETIHTPLWCEFRKKYARYLERFPNIEQTLDNHLSNVEQPLNEDEDRNRSNKRKERIKPKKEADPSSNLLSSSSPQQFMDYFNEKTGKNLKLTNDRKELIKKKLSEGYTMDQLKKAVDNFILDDWDQRHKYIDVIYCIGKQRGKPDNLERWLYFTPPGTKKDPITVTVAISLISRNQTQSTMENILDRLPPEYLEEFVIILKKKSKYLYRMYLHVSRNRAKEGS